MAFGFIDTRLTKINTDPGSTIRIEGREIKVGVPQQALAAAPQMIPLGRPGRPEEAAGAIYLFCTPESNYISGEVVLVAGGAVF
ncbi:MAG: fabG4 [Polaromonas sp.]|nr:fabG4 [Polaromonas sp.]